MGQCQHNFQKFTGNTHQTDVDFQVSRKVQAPSASSIFHVSCNRKKQKKKAREKDELLKKRKKILRNIHPAHIGFHVCDTARASTASSIFFHVFCVKKEKQITKREREKDKFL